MLNKKVYLGDDVYAEYDGKTIILSTDDGPVDGDESNRRCYNKIYLELNVLLGLTNFANEVSKWLEAQ